MNRQAQHRTIRLHRALLWGLVVGVLIYIPVLAIALLVPGGTALIDYLAPGATVFRALAPDTADWPGALTVGLAMVMNGLIYAVVAGVVGVIVNTVRR